MRSAGILLACTVWAAPTPGHAAPPEPITGRFAEIHFAVGPREFQLSRRPVLWGSERVRVDGRPLRPGRDYTLDLASGQLRLGAAPARGAVVAVDYTAPPLLIPAVPLTPDPAPAARPAETTLRTRLADALRRPAPVGAAAEPLPRAASGELREELLAGLRLTEHGETLWGRGKDQAQVSYFRADPTDPRTAGDAREQIQANLDLRPGPTSRLRFASFLSRESMFTEQAEEVERRRLEFEQTFGRSTAALLWERRRTDGRGVASGLDALSLTLTQPFGRNLLAESYLALEESATRGRETEALLSLKQRLGDLIQARAGLQWRGTEYAGASLQSAFTLAVQPGAASISMAYRQADSDLNGRFSRLSADLNLPISRALIVTGEASRRMSEQYGALDTFGLGVAARPTISTLLEAAFSQSTGPLLGREQTQTLRFTADPASLLKLQLGFDRTDSRRAGSADSGLWIVTLGEQRYVRFEGYANAHDPRDDSPYRDALYRLEVRPITPLAFSGQLRRVLLEDEARGVASAGASLKVLRFLEVGANYRQPTHLRDAGEPRGRDYRVILAPLSGFRLFGQYSERPEDDRGLLLDQIHRTAGVETALGSFSLQGSLTRMEGHLSPDPGRRTDLLAILRLGSGTRLYGGLRTEDPLLGHTERERIYRLGITQSAGTAFLMLEGQFGWSLDATGRRAFNGDEARAQARLGLRF